MRVFRPSESLIDANNSLSASFTAERSSSSSPSGPSRTRTNAVRMTVKRLFKAAPATETRDPRACALKTVIGTAVSVGMSTGNTVDARTCMKYYNSCGAWMDGWILTLMTSRSAWRAVPELCPGWRSASSNVGMV